MTFTVLQGDVRTMLQYVDAGTIHCCVTSPPYWGLRDYGMDDQLGLEEKPEDYIANLVQVFREVRRVLRDDATLWVNMGDSYTDGGRGDDTGSTLQGTRRNQREARRSRVREKSRPFGLGRKQLVGMPWRLALALQADGWILRSDIVWSKPNAMPESVTDRPTKSHEYLFLFSKGERYHYDAAAIREPAVKGAAGSEFHSGKTGVHQLGRSSTKPRRSGNLERKQRVDFGGPDGHTGKQAFGIPWEDDGGGRNKRSVWTVSTQPLKEAHFATFPPKLIEPCILAGCPQGGTVLDPFAGAFTTGLVCQRLGRNSLLVELNPEYIDIGRQRLIADGSLFASEEPAA